MWLGSLIGNGRDLDGINLVNMVKCIKYVGIYVGTDYEECYFQHWENILQKLQKL